MSDPDAGPRSAAASRSPAAAPKAPGVKVLSAGFWAAAAPGSSLPAPGVPEIAFAGRSNVGKSSLINRLLDRKNLVRTSSKPGSTRQINVFEAELALALPRTEPRRTTLHLVDLPGYGFNRRSKAERAAWTTLIEGFLKSREALAGIVLLVDLRRGIEEDDRELATFVGLARGLRPGAGLILVATKLDKLPRAARGPALATLARESGCKPIGFSSETGEGKDALWRAILGRADPAPEVSGDPGESGPG